LTIKQGKIARFGTEFKFWMIVEGLRGWWQMIILQGFLRAGGERIDLYLDLWFF